MTDRGLSVVIPVRGRVASLRRLLESLVEARKACPEPVEVIVVDDSEPADSLAHQANCDALQARYLRGPRHVGAKRNVGVRSATYDLIQFIDSDCRASPGLLLRHVTALRAAGVAVGAVAGPTYIEGFHARHPHPATRDELGASGRPAEGAVRPMVARVMARSRRLNSAFEWPAQASRVAWATTSNLAVRRSAFDAVGGFAERPLTVVGGEDVDLGLRLTEAGYAIVCEPAAVVEHAASSIDSLATVCRRLVTYGRSGQWLLTVHPNRGRPKLNRVSTLVVSTVLGLAGAPLSFGLSLLAGPAAAAALLVHDAHERLSGETAAPRAVIEATACAVLDWAFDLGEFIAAWQLRRPDRLFTGFGWTDDAAFVWHHDPAYRYGG